ncbi:MAG: ATP-binding protein [Chloroflexi bacterium]|nr:ATP-binding protein [Chloroflexota bacterium]
MEKRISKRVSAAILQSLSAGVVPRRGAEHIVVGRKAEIETLLRDMDDVIADGGATCRLLVGRYGSGKSFMLQLLRNYAFQRNFVVADADLSPQRRLTGSKGEGLATYRELMMNMAIKTRPDGKAFATVLEKWISKVQTQFVRAGIDRNSRRFSGAVEQGIYDVVDAMEDMVHGADFAKVIHDYWHGHQIGDDDLKAAAIRWLRGEYNVKTEARQALGVRSIIDDESWYDYIKLMASFVHEIGYSGLIIFVDEAVNLHRISHAVSRRNNYERLLSIFNDTRQGGAEYLGVFFGATPDMVQDTRRGLFSYDALKTRLEQSRFVRDGLRDLNAPLIHLDMLSQDEIHSLLQHIREIHAFHHKYESSLDDLQLKAFMSTVSARVGADSLLTPREVVRDFVSLLNLLQQYPDQTFDSILGDVEFTTSDASHLEAEDSPYASFQI